VRGRYDGEREGGRQGGMGTYVCVEEG